MQSAIPMRSGFPLATTAALLAVAAIGCLPRFVAPPVPAPTPAILSELREGVGEREGPVGLRVMVDTALEAVVALAGPFRLPPASSQDAADHARHRGMDEAEHLVVPLRFDWPVDGWVRGYELRLYDGAGAPLDPAFVHHFVVMNFDRRQFLYPTAEKLVAVGRETGDVDLPVSVGVPLSRGQRLGMYAAWYNETGREVEVFLRLVMRWTPADGRRDPTDVLPINLDVNNVPGGSSVYDLPPGRSSRTFEFGVPLDGRLLALSGHLHDYGLAVRLEEVATGREIAKVRGIRDGAGRIVRVEQRKWLGFLGRGIRLHEGRRYRLVGEYDSPEADTIAAGAMAHMVAVFAPDAWSEWPALDPQHPDYRTDVDHWRLDLDAEDFNRTRGHAVRSGGGSDGPR